MVLRFFPNKKGGSSKAIDYLLNEREKLGTAKVLQGDPQLTKDLINSLDFKQKTTVGALCFNEKDLSEDKKFAIMKDFEKHLLPDMDGRYNILWVEHTDKDILELNFVIPKIDLETQKSLNPYYHRADKTRMKAWQDVTNLENNLTNPDDPERKRTLEVDEKKIHLSKDYIELDNLIHEQVIKGNIQSRDSLIELLESNDIKVTRRTKESLSLKLPNSKKAKKFKGSIYDEKFTSIEGIGDISRANSEEIREYNSRDSQAELVKVRKKLERYTVEKTNTINRQYNRSESRNKENVSRAFGSTERRTSRDFKANEKEYSTNGREEQGTAKAEDNREDNINDINNLTNYSSGSIQDSHNTERNPQQHILLANRKVKEKYDSTRTTTNGRTGTRESNEYRAYIESKESRREIYRDIIEDSKRTQGEFRKCSLLFSSNKDIVREQSNQISEQSGAIGHTYPKIKLLTKLNEVVVGYLQIAREVINYSISNLIKNLESLRSKDKTVLSHLEGIKTKKADKAKEISFYDVKATKRVLNLETMNMNRNNSYKSTPAKPKEPERHQRRSQGYSMSR